MNMDGYLMTFADLNMLSKILLNNDQLNYPGKHANKIFSYSNTPTAQWSSNLKDSLVLVQYWK